MDLVVASGGIAAGVAIVGIVVLALWLPSGLSLREARKKSQEQFVLAVGDQSVAAAASTWCSTDLVKIPRPSTFVALELATEFIGIWAGGMAAVRIATIPSSAVVSVTCEYGPFHTTTPIPYLSVQLSGETAEIRFAVSSFGPIKTMSRDQTAAFGKALSDRFAVPLRVSEARQTY
ncbi:hypothetical protein [Herbiconiux sp. YIM B11900]|uniref:hypothetical protein n=1 Tax=Herbiconiux sp. YIM B11900 TaxID=3404131 RepID=UPI003F824415